MHSPRTLIKLVEQSIQIEHFSRQLSVRGLYHDRNRGAYNGWYFNLVRDVETGHSIRIKLPEKISAQLLSGHIYTFEGDLTVSVQLEGVIELVFVVAAFSEAAEKPQKLRALLESNRGRSAETELQTLLTSQQKPRIAIIEGKTSVAMQDIQRALAHAANHYQLIRHPINIMDNKQIVQKLVQLNTDNLDAIAIVRGGGTGVEIFDDVNIAEQALKATPLLITAIGHARDVTLTEKIADAQLATPTAFGFFLREIVEKNESESSDKTPDEAHSQALPVFLLIAFVLTLILIYYLIANPI